MAANADLALIFDEMSALLELTGANTFRVTAHARVGRVLRDLTVDIATLADDEKKLVAIEGIGKGSARKIMEFVETGLVSEHRALLEEVPHGVLDVMAISGVGPKTARMLWEQGGVTDLDSLKTKLESDQLAGLPRMGAKTLENIRASIRFAEKSAQRMRLGKALPAAEWIIDILREVPGTTRVEYAGSLRRGRETIGDIDILAATTDPARLTEAFRTMPEVEQILVAGDTKSSVRLAGGPQVDLRVIDEAAFGAALLYFSGSKEHNVVLRERAIRKKLRLNEYGLFPGDDEDETPQSRGIAPVAADTEEAIYAALDLPWIPPELREVRGEFNGALPELIRLEDIRCELHAHTTASDGRLSIDELAAAAAARGFHTIAVTDHSAASVQANGLSPERLREHIRAIREADAATDGIRILAGTEVDILTDGRLDYDDELLAELDVVVASPHVALRQEPSVATKRLLAAITHPLVHILGHPTGRMISQRDGLAPDIGALVEAAAAHHTALEINANPLRLDLRDTHVRAAVEAGAGIAINTDTHGRADLDHLRYGVMTARRGWLTATGCVNCLSADDLMEWLQSKR